MSIQARGAHTRRLPPARRLNVLADGGDQWAMKTGTVIASSTVRVTPPITNS